MDGLDVIIILDGLDRCPSDGINWILDGLLTTLVERPAPDLDKCPQSEAVERE